MENGTRRELREELDVRGSFDIRPLGLLNDDSNPVGAVHVGLVQLVCVRGTVRVRDGEPLEGALLEPDELAAELSQGQPYETWSSLLIEHIDRLLPRDLAPA